MQHIAFDAHTHYTLASVAAPDGRLVREERIDHERGALRQALGKLALGKLQDEASRMPDEAPAGLE